MQQQQQPKAPVQQQQQPKAPVQQQQQGQQQGQQRQKKEMTESRQVLSSAGERRPLPQQQQQQQLQQQKKEVTAPQRAASPAGRGRPQQEQQQQQQKTTAARDQQQQLKQPKKQQQQQQQKREPVVSQTAPLLAGRGGRPQQQKQQQQQEQVPATSRQATHPTPAGTPRPPPQQQQQQKQKQQKQQQPPASAPRLTSTSPLPRAAPLVATTVLAPPPSIPSIYQSATVERIRQHMAALELGAKVVMESLPVPFALAEWTGTHAHELNAILAQTREMSNVLSIILEREVAEEGREGREGGKKVGRPGQVFVITAMSTNEAQKAKALLDMHLKNQQQLFRTERRLQQAQDDISAVEGAVAAGLRIEFGIQTELAGIVIGKGGENMNRVFAETGVSSINVGDDGMIRVAGPTSAAVMKAREMLELIQQDIHVPLEAVAWLSRPMLGDVKEKSGCPVVRTEKVMVQAQVPEGSYQQQQQQQQQYYQQQQQQ